MIENILIVDTETTGLYPDKGDKVIEIAAILYNVEYKTVLQNISTLFPCTANPVEHINGINAQATIKVCAFDFINEQLKIMAKHSQAMVAHNASFDKKFMKTLSVWPDIVNLPWICTKEDFKWPVPLYRNRLQDVCHAMNVPYVDAHRALNDCRLIAECFNRVGDLGMRLQSALNSSQRTGTYGNVGNAYS